jgi:hypothetical protein
MSFLVQIKFITEDSNQIHRELRSLIKTKDSIIYQKIYTTDEKGENQAWLGLGRLRHTLS